MKSRNTRQIREQNQKLILIVVFGLGLLFQVGTKVFKCSTVQAAQVQTIIGK